MFRSFLLVVCLTLTQTEGIWVNEFDKPMNFKCPPGQVISYLHSVHDNFYDDRQWEIFCRADPEVTSECKQSDYVNEFEQSIAYTCPLEAALTGIESYHENEVEDRRFKFTCCNTVKPVKTKCSMTEYVNEYDNELKYTVPPKSAIRIIYSTFDTQRNDRRFSFQVCSL